PVAPAGTWALLALLVIVAPYSIGRYYARAFGQVQASRWRTGALTFVTCVVGFLWFEWLQETVSPSVSLPVLFVAVVLARLGLVANRLRVHYLWIAAAVAAFAALPRGSVSADVR